MPAGAAGAGVLSDRSQGGLHEARSAGGAGIQEQSMQHPTPGEPADGTPAELIDARIKALGDWRGETLARIRALIHEADPDVVETVKWGRTPVWEHDGILCTGETYKAAVKTTFARGASLPDPKGIFNSSLEGGTRRAIDFREGETIDAEGFKALIRAAVDHNRGRKTDRRK